MLTPENKQVRLTTSLENLSLYNTDPAKFLRRYVTMDETRVHHFDPETKIQSKAWKQTYHLTAGSQIPQDCLRRQSYGICLLGYNYGRQEAQLSIKVTKVSQGHKTWYHSIC